MKETHGPLVLTKTENLMNDLMEVTKKYPKTERYTLGERTEKILLDTVESIYFASYSRQNRLQHLENARMYTQLLQFLLRIARRKKFISDNLHEKIVLDLIEIGKMLTGWIKTCSQGKGSHAQTL